MIGNLQILRAIAALGVVLYHTDYRFIDGVHTDLLGVATFFALSGFLMCFITMEDADGFLTKRMIRIVPLYWLCTVIVIVIAHRHHLATTWQHLAPWAIESLFFLPSDQSPILGVGWTLNFEIYFYVVFAAALWISRRFAPLIACAALFAVMAAHDLAPDVVLIGYYSHDYVRFFILGIVVFYLWRARDRLPKWPAILLGSCAIIGSYALMLTTPSPGWISHYTLPPVILGAALLMAGSGADITWRPLTLIGDASYALYLTHTIVMEITRAVAPGFISAATSSAAAMILLVVFCLAIGVVFHLVVEKPMLRFIRSSRWTAFRQRAAAQPAQ